MGSGASRSSSSTTIGTNRPDDDEEEVQLPQPRLGRAGSTSLNRNREVASTPSTLRRPPPMATTQSVAANGPPARNGVGRKPAASPQPARRQLSPRKVPVDSNKSEPQAAAPSQAAARRSIFAPKARDDLVACSNCGRNFAEDRIDKHTSICVKTSKKKRKTFDMTKKRLQGTDAEQFLKKQGKSFAAVAAKPTASKAQPAGKKGDWRKKREEFIAVLRAAKEAQRHLAAGGKISDLPPPPPMDTSDYIQCPHCGRKFSESAADRHIPKCKDIKSNKR